MEAAQRELAPLLRLAVGPELQQHQLPRGVDQVGRVERAALGLAARARPPP